MILFFSHHKDKYLIIKRLKINHKIWIRKLLLQQRETDGIFMHGFQRTHAKLPHFSYHSLQKFLYQ